MEGMVGRFVALQETIPDGCKELQLLPVRGAERIVWKTAFEDGWEVYLSAKSPVGMQRGWRSI